MNGHWFCHHCNDIVFMKYEAPSGIVVHCPACGRCTAEFIPAKLTRAMINPAWFDAMRQVASGEVTAENAIAEMLAQTK